MLGRPHSIDFSLLHAHGPLKAGDGLMVDLMHPYEMTMAETGKPFWRDKRLKQAAQIVPLVVFWASQLGSRPKWDPRRTWVH